ncbi:H-type small acid-soluble spore protein [Bacillus sp. EAC]|uniref:H-type small acid-soluble spore protein n=1 Tax=Bacillus sp. EAC TaxID=1978338 RepID=UPI000B4392B2|nr:H-type small acid-soluble spore protein [Bacillus sp. EAC]
MDTERALEIVSSPNMIEVTCEGVPIYIQHVNKNEGTARIYPLDEPQNDKEVSLSHLKEH